MQCICYKGRMVSPLFCSESIPFQLIGVGGLKHVLQTCARMGWICLVSFVVILLFELSERSLVFLKLKLWSGSCSWVKELRALVWRCGQMVLLLAVAWQPWIGYRPHEAPSGLLCMEELAYGSCRKGPWRSSHLTPDELAEWHGCATLQGNCEQ